jgi:hypothetical protein
MHTPPRPTLARFRLQLAKTVTGRAWLVLPFLGCLAAASCGPSHAALHVSVSPDPVTLDVDIPCAGVFASFPCAIPDRLLASWTLSVSTSNSVGGRGTISVVVVDAATGTPLANQQGTVSGEMTFVLGSNESVAITQKLSWPIQGDFTHAGTFALVFTIQLTDTMGEPITETLTVPGKFPPGESVGARPSDNSLPLTTAG